MKCCFCSGILNFFLFAQLTIPTIQIYKWGRKKFYKIMIELETSGVQLLCSPDQANLAGCSYWHSLLILAKSFKSKSQFVYTANVMLGILQLSLSKLAQSRKHSIRKGNFFLLNSFYYFLSKHLMVTLPNMCNYRMEMQS